MAHVTAIISVVPQAPAAFGLVSFLMHSGLEKKHIQGHLLAFSAAAPVVTIATYFILQAVRSHTPANAIVNDPHPQLLCSGNSSSSWL